MLECSKCKKKIKHTDHYSYGLRNGHVFAVILCDNCKNIPAEEYEKLEERSINEKQ